MSDTDPTKRRGRPTTGKAMTSAERMARLREKAKQAVWSEEKPDLSDLPDSALLDFLRQAYQGRMTWHMADAVRELFERANARGASYPVRPAFERIETEADTPVTVTEKSKARGYSTEVKALAVAMADRGETSRAIHAAILETCGRAPDISNLARLVRGWRENQG